jgi:hypothetical protein
MHATRAIVGCLSAGLFACGNGPSQQTSAAPASTDTVQAETDASKGPVCPAAVLEPDGSCCAGGRVFDASAQECLFVGPRG